MGGEFIAYLLLKYYSKYAIICDEDDSWMGRFSSGGIDGKLAACGGYTGAFCD